MDKDSAIESSLLPMDLCNVGGVSGRLILYVHMIYILVEGGAATVIWMGRISDKMALE